MRVLKVGPDEIAFQQQDDYEFVKRILDWLELHYYRSSLKIDDIWFLRVVFLVHRSTTS